MKFVWTHKSLQENCADCKDARPTACTAYKNSLLSADGKGAELGLFKVAVIKLLYPADERNGVPGTGGLVVK